VNRWLALAVAIVTGGAAAFALIAVGTAAVAGFLWIYVFGDDPWPAGAERTLSIAVPVIGLLIWIIASWRIFRTLMAS
jgi:hypothetical protein